ncbi:NDP-hexose 2,3-dehydratase family protein [Amycolatopsis sp. cmx-11-12]|uniref:NDP-hexose 2,3-dehydratase family protein n=1 Tax=Amycolatopsis sp. cmx-11-12 TaxID=2785795 RepID=UPI003917B9EC
MENSSAVAALLAPKDDKLMAVRIAESVLAREGAVTTLADFHRWFAEFGQRTKAHVERVPLDKLVDWYRSPETGTIGHRSGKFFTVEGLNVQIPAGPVSNWDQPIINQPEIGVLGILVKEIEGVLHCLMQAKFEPGNRNEIQLSPTVQATRSNYTKVHKGKPVPYLAFFQDAATRNRVIADVRQSEQGSWFHHKRNRNMVVEVEGDVELLDGFCWLTLGQIHQLLAVDDLVNMDARTVLSCLPFAGVDVLPALSSGTDQFRDSLVRSYCGVQGSLCSTDEVLSWITEVRTRTEVHTSAIPLNAVRQWYRTEEKIAHTSGRYFDVIGVDVRAGGREVGHWMQPMIAPIGRGVVALVVRQVQGVLHALVHARTEPGYVDVIELAPTVQCTPDNYLSLPAAARPRFLDTVLGAEPGQIRFEAILSEEGGRFYHARNRYLVVEVDEDPDLEHSDFRWVTLHQLVDLLRHSHYLNIQARSLVACLHSLSSNSPGR